MNDKDNANPTILSLSQLPTRKPRANRSFDFLNLDPKHKAIVEGWQPKSITVTEEPIDQQDIYDLISPLKDPEHPISLGQLAVVNLPDIEIDPPPSLDADRDQLTRVLVKITPTITHCSLATVIGLCVRVRLEQTLPANYRIDVVVKKGTHTQDDQVNKQLADKERVAAALENETLKNVLSGMMKGCQ